MKGNPYSSIGESFACGIRIPVTIETQNPSFTDKDWTPPESKTVLDSLTWGDTKSKLLD